jgi:hypothetical protein
MALTSRTANRLLWTAQTLLALLFLFAGIMKFVMSPEQMQGPVTFSLGFIRFIGIAETLGALGLVLPGLTRIRTELTGLAASGLVIIMIGASTVTAASMGVAAAAFPFVVGLVAASVAYGRWQFAPRRHAITVLEAA